MRPAWLALALCAVPLCGCRAPLATAEGKSPTGLFTDEAARAGIRFQLDNGARGRHHIIETTGSGCAFFDYDVDGYPDVLLLQAGPQPWSSEPAPSGPGNRLYRNNRDGTFTDVTPGSGLEDTGYSQAVAVGDVDGDGFPDVFVTAYGGNRLLRNLKGSGRFQDITARSGVGDRSDGRRWATSSAFGDFNNDGKLDLYQCRYAVYDPRKERGCTNPRGQSSYCSPEIYREEVHALYRGNGDGTFADVSGPAGITRHRGRGLGVAWLDYNGDGWEDIFVANDLSPFLLWRNNRNGTFTNVAEEAGVAYSDMGQLLSGMGVAVRDYNGDALEDLLITNFSGQMNALYRNERHGAFTNVTIPSGIGPASFNRLAFGCEFIDYDRDGHPDLVIGNGHVNEDVEAYSQGVEYAQPKSLLRNRGDGTFQDVREALGDLGAPSVTRGLAVADYDLDGHLDVLATNHDRPVQLLRYSGPSTNHWFALSLRGAKSNPNGYHARVTVTAGGRSQTAEMRAGSSFASHSGGPLYFGLGSAETVEEVVIRWHGSNALTRLRDLQADRVYRITEGGEARPFPPAPQETHR